MEINPKLIILKLHYFLHLGGLAPVIPFMLVYARHLGVPVALQGTLQGCVFCVTLLIKPLIASLADQFPTSRKYIFLFILGMCYICYSSLGFIPRFNPLPPSEGLIVITSSSNSTAENNHLMDKSEENVFFITKNLTVCQLGEGVDCIFSCISSSGCSLDDEMQTNYFSLMLVSPQSLPTSINASYDDYLTYEVSKGNTSKLESGYTLKITCLGGALNSAGCNQVLSVWYFWIFVLLLLLAGFAGNTATSINDAICVDQIKSLDDYGFQRAWGTVGWGTMGVVSGLLVDWASGVTDTKDYSPAFFILITFGIVDMIVTILWIKVPIVKAEKAVWSSVCELLRNPRFTVFLFFVTMGGLFDGIFANYIFLMQEDMAKGTKMMTNLKFLQGLTIGAQCILEAPFMFACSWFLKHFRTRHIIAMTFFLYVFRFAGQASIGMYGPVWLTPSLELLNGPCYGLGYTAIVVYAGSITPRGVSTTVQSITNVCYEVLGFSLALGTGGLLFDFIGGPHLCLVFSLVAAVTFLLHLLSMWLLPPLEESDADQLTIKNTEEGDNDQEEHKMITVEEPQMKVKESTPVAPLAEEEEDLKQSF